MGFSATKFFEERFKLEDPEKWLISLIKTCSTKRISLTINFSGAPGTPGLYEITLDEDGGLRKNPVIKKLFASQFSKGQTELGNGPEQVEEPQKNSVAESPIIPPSFGETLRKVLEGGGGDRGYRPEQLKTFFPEDEASEGSEDGEPSMEGMC